MNGFERMTPHAAILFANMYYVFYGIDRVNKPMNFIDNGLTKGLLVLLCAAMLPTLARLWRAALERRTKRSRRASAQWGRLLFAGVNTLLCAVFLALLLADALLPGKMLMLNEFVKAWILAMCIVSQWNAICAVARGRAYERYASRRTAASQMRASRPR